MTLQDTGKIDKGWGYEIVWANNAKYSAKLLVFERAGARTSMVLHKERAKTWFVNGGRFKFKFIDAQTGELKEAVLEEGQTVDLAELSPHQLESLVDNSIIFEVGTPDNVEDRIRLSPGDSQTPTSTPQ